MSLQPQLFSPDNDDVDDDDDNDNEDQNDDWIVDDNNSIYPCRQRFVKITGKHGASLSSHYYYQIN